VTAAGSCRIFRIPTTFNSALCAVKELSVSEHYQGCRYGSLSTLKVLSRWGPGLPADHHERLDKRAQPYWPVRYHHMEADSQGFIAFRYIRR
jgi:hypothetical protein